MHSETEPHFIGKIAQKGIIEFEGRVLITRDMHDGGVWELPGGRLHKNEVPQAGLSREIHEELGLELTIGNVVYVEQFVHPRGNEAHVLIVYHIPLSSKIEQIIPKSDEVWEYAWITSIQLDEYSFFDSYRRALHTFFNSRAT